MPSSIEIEVTVGDAPILDVEIGYSGPSVGIEINRPVVPVIEIDLSNIGPRGLKGDKGDQGDPGPTGATGGTYTHTQALASATWTINHNLGYFPNVTVVDSAEDEVVGDINYVNNNTLIISFNGGFSGNAYLS
jgi:hypothetical protein